MAIEFLERAHRHDSAIAVIDSEGKHSYREIAEASKRFAALLLREQDDLEEARIAFLVPPSAAYVVTQWAIWHAGGIAVPLALSHPKAEMARTLDDCGASIVVVHPAWRDRLPPLPESCRLVETEQAAEAPRSLPEIAPDRKAMIIYTSGTTSRPKGVVTTHRHIEAQIRTLVDAWAWSSNDVILGFLPLHHVHGLINVLSCALWSGATCELFETFDTERVWSRVEDGDVTLFMAVPTIYRKLQESWEAGSTERKRARSAGCARMRVMISGSAALPVSLLEAWKTTSGHVLLERYGMTEIGMALSNPLHGQRVAGRVGAPLPGVEIKLVDDDGQVTIEGPGEVHVRGPSVFQEYWRRPQATEESFVDGWFRTGDIGEYDGSSYRLLGRRSTDIIKTGGYKVSALEIEEVLRTHPGIRECAVIGLPDDEWGERVAAYLETHESLSGTELKEWARERLAPYKVPSRWTLVDSLPRNAMGKVVKTRLGE